jgi:hypothetical protein
MHILRLRLTSRWGKKFSLLITASRIAMMRQILWFHLWAVKCDLKFRQEITRRT